MIEYDLNQAKRFVLFRQKFLGTQADASKICGCSQKTISYIEVGKLAVTLKILTQLILKKKLNCEWFLTGNGSMQLSDPIKANVGTSLSELKSDLAMLSKQLLVMEARNNAIIRELEVLKKMGPK